jgi:hypothetical protein
LQRIAHTLGPLLVSAALVANACSEAAEPTSSVGVSDGGLLDGPRARDAGAKRDAQSIPYELHCPDLRACTLGRDRYEKVWDAPAGVELRAATGDVILGYDTAAQVWVLYRVQLPADRLLGPRVTLARVFGTDVRTVEVATDGFVWCRGNECRWGLGEDTDPVLPEFARPRAIDRGCIAGKDVWCTEGGPFLRKVVGVGVDGALAMSKHATPTYGGTLSSFLDADGTPRLRDSDGSYDRSWVMPEPIVELTTQPGYDKSRTWIGRSAGGRLYIGDQDNAHACDSNIEAIAPGARHLVRHEGRWLGVAVQGGRAGCYDYAPPAGTRMLLSLLCGIGTTSVAITPNAVWATPIVCAAG